MNAEKPIEQAVKAARAQRGNDVVSERAAAEFQALPDFSYIKDFRLPRYEELPDFGLYLEQALEVLNSALAPLALDPISKPMMSNYVKHGAVPPAQKKRYYRENLCYALATGVLRQSFTVEQVGEFFHIQRDTYPLEVAYDFFCTEFENALREAFYFTGNALPTVETLRTDQTVFVRAMVLAAANNIFVSHFASVVRAARE